MSSQHLYDVEPTDHGTPIPVAVFADKRLSGIARAVLLAVHGRPHSISRPSLDWIIQTLGYSRARWLKASRELVSTGWLIRRNHGGGGRGVWRHERVFLRAPQKSPLEE